MTYFRVRVRAIATIAAAALVIGAVLAGPLRPPQRPSRHRATRPCSRWTVRARSRSRRRGRAAPRSERSMRCVRRRRVPVHDAGPLHGPERGHDQGPDGDVLSGAVHRYRCRPLAAGADPVLLGGRRPALVDRLEHDRLALRPRHSLARGPRARAGRSTGGRSARRTFGPRSDTSVRRCAWSSRTS